MIKIKREIYSKKLAPFINKPVIKVITGLRRSGKSYFLEQIIDELQTNHKVKKSQIIYINKENIDFDHIQDYKDLNNFIKSNKSKEKTYIFIDEIQDVDGWEKAIRSLFGSNDYDIYITGSNSKLLSSELATHIAGRYIEITLYPLCFKEFCEFRKIFASSGEPRTREKDFEQFIKYGSLPGIHNFEFEDKTIYQFLSSVLDTIILKEIVSRHEIRSISTFNKVLRYVFDNISCTLSAKKISDYFKSQKLKVSIEVIQNYLAFIEAAFAIKKTLRYDIKGKRHLEIYEKYYVTDWGLRHALLGHRNQDISQILENIVYQELLVRGYTISIGKINDLEIDFIAEKTNEKRYIQVAYLLNNEDTLNRELRPLKQIKDDYPKLIISMDTALALDYEGISRVNIIDWLCENTT